MEGSNLFAGSCLVQSLPDDLSGVVKKSTYVFRASCLTLEINEFRCYRGKVKGPAADRSQTQDTSGLSCQCSATEPWQLDDHQPSQSSISTAQVVFLTPFRTLEGGAETDGCSCVCLAPWLYTSSSLSASILRCFREATDSRALIAFSMFDAREAWSCFFTSPMIHSTFNTNSCCVFCPVSQEECPYPTDAAYSPQILAKPALFRCLHCCT